MSFFGRRGTTSSTRYCFCQMLEAEQCALDGGPSKSFPPPHDFAWRGSSRDSTKTYCEDHRLSSVLEDVHARHRAALCLSGGGIRSATFALGVLQGLAQRGSLERFDYLSTVSGGGYIGSWLTALVYWAHQNANGTGTSGSDAAADALRKLSANGQPFNGGNREPAAVRHLRAFSNYLTPQYGLLSADTWTVVATYVRNLLLTWLLLVPLLFAGLLLPRIAVAIVTTRNTSFVQQTALLFAGIVLVGLAIAYMGTQLPSSDPKRRGQTSFLYRCLLPLVLSGVAMTTFWSWLPFAREPERDLMPALWWFVGFGVVAHIFGSVGTWLVVVTRVARRDGSWWTRVKAVFGKVLRKVVGLFAVVIVGAAGGALGGLLVIEIDPLYDPVKYPSLYVMFAMPVYLGCFGAAGMLLAGILSKWTNDDDREWWSRAGAWIVIVMLGWIAISGIVLYGPLAIAYAPKVLAATGGVAGLYAVLFGSSSKSKATQQKNGVEATQSKYDVALKLAAPLTLVLLLSALSFGTDRLLAAATPSSSIEAATNHETKRMEEALDPRRGDASGDATFRHASAVHHAVLTQSTLRELGAWFIGAMLLTTILSELINPNRFSLHAMYRNRLIRAYLGASRPQRSPHPFTGFDPEDNLYMRQLAYPSRQKNAPRGHAHPNRPFHVVNIALNLVRGKNLAWQERKAQSFTVSPLHSGNHHLGYRESAEYGGKDHGISLGTAVTISGAAASPNMGYNSSPVVTFLMTLFNARLGWWLGNPGKVGDTTYRHEFPRWSMWWLLAEAFGLTDADSKYVYLSDGGHFENLGIYEMVLRRCRFILVTDGGADPDCTFEDLANALRKIYIDLGIPIEFDAGPPPMVARTTDKKVGGRYVVARIRYKEVDGPQAHDGFLIYVKATLCYDEPPDVTQYASASPQFPHEPTSDQWFSETQFESYRALGRQTIDAMLTNPPRPLGATPLPREVSLFLT